LESQMTDNMANRKGSGPTDGSQPKSSAADSAYARIKHEIMWGEIEPGTLLSELQLAARFGVSRTPVREALNLLTGDGLITTLPRRGHLVHTVSFTEILDAFRLRELLEVEAAGLAARRMTDEEIARLGEMIETRDSSDLPTSDREFHTSIARGSGNRLLADFVERLLMLMHRVLIVDPHLVERTEEGTNEMLAIVDALAARDEPAAREAMRSHIRNTLAAIMGRARGTL
jgi:DNA-binding GntR family transcriptional regulator